MKGVSDMNQPNDELNAARQHLAKLEKTLGPVDRKVGLAHLSVALQCDKVDRREEAEASFQKSIDILSPVDDAMTLTMVRYCQAKFYFERRRYADAEAAYRRQLDDAQDLPLKDRFESTSCTHLGIICRRDGRTEEAAQFFLRALQAADQEYDADDLEREQYLRPLADAYLDLGRWNDAEQTYLLISELAEKHFEDGSGLLAARYCIERMIVLNQRRDNQELLGEWQTVLASVQEHYAKFTADAQRHSEAAAIYSALKRFEIAMKLLELIRAFFVKHWGRDCEPARLVDFNIAKIHRELGDLDRAATTAADTHEYFLNNYGPYNAHLADVCHEQALICSAQQRKDEALAFAEQAERIWSHERLIAGKQYAMLGWCHLATFYRDQRLFDKAAELFERSLSLAKAHDPDGLLVATISQDLAEMREYQHRDAEAAHLAEEATTLKDATPKVSSPAAIQRCWNVGRSLLDIQEDVNARWWLQSAVTLMEDEPDKYRLALADVLVTLASLDLRAEEHEVAYAEITRARELYQRCDDLDLRRDVQSRFVLAGCQREVGRYEEAESTILSYLATVEQQVSKDSILINEGLISLASTYAKWQKPESALRVTDQVLERIDTPSCKFPDVLANVLDSKATLLRRLGRHEEVRQIQQRLHALRAGPIANQK